MSPLALTVLGSFEITVDGVPVTDFPTAKTSALLLYMAIEADAQPERMYLRRALAGLLWPDIGDKFALQNLRNTLYYLRQSLDKMETDLPETMLEITRQQIRLHTAHVPLDLVRFQSLLGTASAHDHANLYNCVECLGRLSEGLSLYRGELLAGFSLPDAPAFEEWLLLRREMVHQQAVGAAIRLAQAHETRRALDEASHWTHQLLEWDPYREESHRQLMRIYARQGNPQRALTHYQTLQQLFRTEFDMDSSSETQKLVQRIAAGEFEPQALSSTNHILHDTVSHDVSHDTVSHEPVPATANPPQPVPTASPASHLDLNDVPEVGPFFGRTQEQEQLAQWLLHDDCRVVALLGIGGMGKTTLAAQAVRGLAARASERFDVILWRSLLNAPPLQELLPPLLQTLLEQQLVTVPESIDEQLRLLLQILRERRVLLVLDNFESILKAEDAGALRIGYEAYGQLIQQVAMHGHRSHLLLTSRERPRGYARLEGDGPRVRSLQLNGLDANSSRELLAQRGLPQTSEEATPLIARYSGNPLALKLVADTIESIFGGDITGFLTEESVVFDDVRAVLDQQFARLASLEQDILYVLAVEREALSVSALRDSFPDPPPQRALLESLRNLQRRSLIERHEAGFTLQNVIIEYLSDRLIEIASQEFETGTLEWVHRVPLLKAQAKEYVRQSQVRMILTPICEHLLARHDRAHLAAQAEKHLNQLRLSTDHASSYAGGNILNLLLQLQIDITGFDFSQLAIRQAYLRNATLHAVNFAGTKFSQIALADTFGDVRTLAFSPDGELVAAGTAAGEISLWRTADAQMIAILQDDAAPIWSIAFSPDGTLLASGSTDHLVRLWDVRTAHLRGRLRGHTKTVRSVAFRPDGSLLASSGDDRTVRLWDLPDGELRNTLANGHAHSIRTIAFSPDGSLLASGSDDHKVLLWDVESGAIQQTLLGHDGWVRSVAFSPDGSLLASGGDNHKVFLWNVQRGQIQQTLLGHDGWVESVAFSPDGALLASGGDDQTVRIWNVATGKLQHALPGHSGWINSVAFSPDGKTLVSGDDDRNVYLWDVQSQKPLHHLLGHTLSVESVDISPDGTLLVSGNGDQTLRFWRLAESGDPAHLADPVHYAAHVHPIPVGHVVVVAFSADGRTLASGTADRTVHLIDVARRQITHTLHGHSGWIKSVAFSPDGQHMASGSTDQTIRLWNVHTGHIQRILGGHTGWINALAFSPDATLVASSSGDETIRLWDVKSGTLRRTFTGHVGWVNDVIFSPDGMLLISAGADQTVRLWDLHSGHLLQTLEGHSGWVWKVAITKDGQILASGSHDKTVQLWDLAPTFSASVANGTPGAGARLLHTLHGHAPWVTDIALNSPTRILASSSGNQTIRLWHIDTGTSLQALQIPGPYQGMNITGISGLSAAQKTVLKTLGAQEFLS